MMSLNNVWYPHTPLKLQILTGNSHRSFETPKIVCWTTSAVILPYSPLLCCLAWGPVSNSQIKTELHSITEFTYVNRISKPLRSLLNHRKTSLISRVTIGRKLNCYVWMICKGIGCGVVCIAKGYRRLAKWWCQEYQIQEAVRTPTDSCRAGKICQKIDTALRSCQGQNVGRKEKHISQKRRFKKWKYHIHSFSSLPLCWRR